MCYFLKRTDLVNQNMEMCDFGGLGGGIAPKDSNLLFGTFFGGFTVTSDRNAESCNRIPSNYCLP